MTKDEWGIRKMSDEDLIKTLRNPITCQEVEIVSVKEALARILERLKIPRT